MRYRNFSFGHIEVELNGVAHDLHNFYDFESFSYDVIARKIVFRLTKVEEEWVPSEEPSAITINFINVNYFSAEPRDKRLPFTEDDCIECIGFVEPDAPTKDFYLLDNPTEIHHCVVRFQSGLILRIQAEEAICDIQNA